MQLVFPWVEMKMPRNQEKNNNEVHKYQHDTTPSQIQFTPVSPNDHSSLSNRTSLGSFS